MELLNNPFVLSNSHYNIHQLKITEKSARSSFIVQLLSGFWTGLSYSPPRCFGLLFYHHLFNTCNTQCIHMSHLRSLFTVINTLHLKIRHGWDLVIQFIYNHPDDSSQHSQQKQRHLVLGSWYNRLGLCNTWSLLFGMHILWFSVHIVEEVHRQMMLQVKYFIGLKKRRSRWCNTCCLSPVTHISTLS